MLRDPKRRRYHHEDLVQQGGCSPLGRGLHQGQFQNEIYRRRLDGQFRCGAVEAHTRRIFEKSHIPVLSPLSHLAHRPCERVGGKAFAYRDTLFHRGEEFVIFDGGRHGYDNMFCDEHDPSELEHRPLKRYEIPASKLVLELGYSIDYEDEKEDFEPDEAGTVELINGERMPWEQVKRDGIDYIALYYVNEKGKPVQILDAELA